MHLQGLNQAYIPFTCFRDELDSGELLLSVHAELFMAFVDVARAFTLRSFCIVALNVTLNQSEHVLVQPDVRP